MIKLGQKVKYIKRAKTCIDREVGCNFKKSGTAMVLYRANLRQSNRSISDTPLEQT